MSQSRNRKTSSVSLAGFLVWFLVVTLSMGAMRISYDAESEAWFSCAAIVLAGAIVAALVFLQRCWKGTIVVLALLLIAYVSSYLVLSRRGFADADQYNFAGFYFFVPEHTDEWRRWNYGLCAFYLPLIWIDNLIGTGRWPASEPTYRLS